jgi:hypothetical protein
MTDEEATRLDEKWTKTPPKAGPNGTGYFTRCKNAALSVTIDNVTANYLTAKAIAAGKTPAEIISDMIQKEIAASL